MFSCGLPVLADNNLGATAFLRSEGALCPRLGALSPGCPDLASWHQAGRGRQQGTAQGRGSAQPWQCSSWGGSASLCPSPFLSRSHCYLPFEQINLRRLNIWNGHVPPAFPKLRNARQGKSRNSSWWIPKPPLQHNIPCSPEHEVPRRMPRAEGTGGWSCSCESRLYCPGWGLHGPRSQAWACPCGSALDQGPGDPCPGASRELCLHC